MSHRYSIRLGLAVAWGLGVVAASPVARAEGPEGSRLEFKRPKDKRECAAAHDAAIAEQQAGHLRAASMQFASCASRICGPLFQKCTAAFEQLDPEIPTVIPRVTDNTENLAIQVQMDGQPLVAHLDDQPIAVDPGVHEFTFSGPNGVIATRKIMVAQGVHELSVAITLHEPAPGAPAASGDPSAPASASPGGHTAPPASEVPEIVHDEGDHPRGGSTPVGWGLTAVGVAGVGVGAAFLLTGTHSRWNVAITSGAGGLGALIGGIWVLASGHPASDKAPAHARLTFDVAPTDGGAFASAVGTF